MIQNRRENPPQENASLSCSSFLLLLWRVYWMICVLPPHPPPPPTHPCPLSTPSSTFPTLNDDLHLRDDLMASWEGQECMRLCQAASFLLLAVYCSFHSELDLPIANSTCLCLLSAFSSLEVHTENFLCDAAEGPQRLYVCHRLIVTCLLLALC